ncbi:hypothetical protein [Pseudomonas sp.]|uniref:hypothetical protein n=1 Tax=Pseudomonas sp. TaxID=306 RepID=UPI003CC63BD4
MSLSATTMLSTLSGSPAWFNSPGSSCLICRRTMNLRTIQLLLCHMKLKSTVRYLGIEVDDALEMAEQIEV